MTKPIYKLTKLKNLVAAKEAVEAKNATGDDRKGTFERPEPAPTSAIPETKPTPPATPVQQHGVNGNGNMPKSLEGISALDLSLLDLDGMLTGEEQIWYNKRKIKALGRYRHRTPGPNDWMGM